MLDCLPEYLEPARLADAGRSFRGSVAVAQLERVRPELAQSTGTLEVEMRFRLDERRIRVLEGRIGGTLSLVCQRCLQALRLPLELEFRLGIVADEVEAGRLPAGYEPLLANGEPLRSVDLVEDEVLLALPAIAVHGDAEPCSSGYRNRPLPQPDSPFAVLEKLKTRTTS
ncbi:MAG TPA: metal-binding protein [Gammaproteobacteria bacterium]|nr:metal-binding protein [Gammaproteobacteria bacterium]